jgi:hypothetical protein
MRSKLAEFLVDLWRVTKLMAGVLVVPVGLYLILLWTGVLK